MEDGKLEDILFMKVSYLEKSKVPGRQIFREHFSMDLGSGSSEADFLKVLNAVREKWREVREILDKEDDLTNEEDLLRTRLYERELKVKVSIVDYRHQHLRFEVDLVEVNSWKYLLNSIWNAVKFK